jgi:hypothetical protein
MIRNEEELQRARERLALIKEELALLRHGALHGNRRTHDLMCEYFVKRIDEVQAEINGFQAPRAATTADAPYHDHLEAALGDRGQA